MKRKTVSILLALAIVASGFAGGSGEKKADAAKTGTKKLTVMASRGAGVLDYDTNAYIVWLEKQTGVDAVWQQIPTASLPDKLPVVMMSGSLPDVLLGCALSSAQQVDYGLKEKLIVPLNELIDKYGTEAKRMFNEQKGCRQIVTLTDGNIYALPTYSDILHVNYAQKVIINTAFLKKLGLSMPTTTAEFYDCLKSIKQKDPNGNGKADEVPLLGNTTGWHHDPFPWLTEPFIFDDGKYGKKVDLDSNGRLFSILDKEGYREALRYIRKLYAEGLLYEGSLTMKAEQNKQFGENPDAMILGAGFAAGNGSYTVVGGERYQNYRALPPIKGPSGLQQTPWFRYVNVRQGAFAITKACKDRETAIKFGDFMLSYDATMRLRMGEKDVDWRDARPGELTMDKRPAKWVRINPYTGDPQNKHLDNDGMFYETRGMFLDDSAVDPKTGIMEGVASQFLLAQETREKYIQYAKEVFPPVTIAAESADEFATLETELKKYYEEARAAFVTGAKDLDKDWDAYVKDLKRIGLDKYLQILQAAYDKAAIKIGA